ARRAPGGAGEAGLPGDALAARPRSARRSEAARDAFGRRRCILHGADLHRASWRDRRRPGPARSARRGLARALLWEPAWRSCRSRWRSASSRSRGRSSSSASACWAEKESLVTPIYLMAAGLAVALFVYLVVALLAPEKLGW